MTSPYSQMLTSRFCHDMANPLGAIGNGLELLALSLPGESEEMQLARKSFDAATARLRLFRLAFGQAKPDAPSQGLVDEIEECWQQNSKIALTITHSAGISGAQQQLVALTLLCIENSLLRGGDVQVSVDDTGLTAIATGPRIRFDPMLWEHACGKATTLPEASRLHFTALYHAANAIGLSLDIDGSETQILISFFS